MIFRRGFSSIVNSVFLVAMVLGTLPFGVPKVAAQNPPSGMFTMSTPKGTYDKSGTNRTVQISWAVSVNTSGHNFTDDAFFGIEIVDFETVSSATIQSNGGVKNQAENYYNYDGKMIHSSPDSRANFGVYSPDIKPRQLTRKATFTLVDNFSGEKLEQKGFKTAKYDIRPIYIIALPSGSSQLAKAYYGPRVTVNIDLTKSTGGGLHDANWYKENYFPKGGTFSDLSISCSSPPPSITMRGETFDSSRSRPAIKFTLKQVLRVRNPLGTAEFQNKFYFIGDDKAPNLAIVVSDAINTTSREDAQHYYLADHMRLDDASDDVVIPGVTLKMSDAFISSFEKCVLNRYYNKFDSATNQCVANTAGKGTDHKVGETSQTGNYKSFCLADSTDSQLVKDGVKSTGPTGDFNADEGGGDDECLKAFAGWQRYIIGKAICGMMEAMASFAIILANVSFNFLIYASGLQ